MAFIIHHSSFIVAPPAFAQVNRREPYGGYVYPAGAKQGSSLQVIVGGQNLQGANVAHFSGGGVRATIVDYGRPLSRKQLGDVAMHLRALIQGRLAEAMGRQAAGVRKQGKDGQAKEELPELPDHPWLRDLEKKTLKELDDLRLVLFDKKKQPNAQIGEMLWMDVVVEAKAAPGVRELRLETPRGLSNPVRFTVGAMPEVVEREPNSMQAARPAGQAAALTLPVVVNGQIMPGDTDVCRFDARKGQKLVITAQARSLIPYLADAVPGWFQATLTLYDAKGKEMAYGDDYRFEPDPVLYYEVPQDGEYALEIHDSIYRGRDDFIYRITIGEQPFITSIFPLGGRAGAPTTAALTGWNLSVTSMQLDTQRVGGFVLEPAATWGQAPDRPISSRIPTNVVVGQVPVPIAYAVDALPEVMEAEPNDVAAAAQKLTLPLIVNGRIGKAGDVDVFRFEGRAGDEVVAEVQARRLGSPLDSVLRLSDATGHVIALNDDHEDKAAGLLTHHADSYLSAKLPKHGTYTVALGDAQHHGGAEYAYRLRLSPRQPDFALRMTPSSLKIPAGRTVPLTVHVLRQDGFDGEVELALTGASTGFTLSGGRIPAGRDFVHLTVTAPTEGPAISRPVLQLEGRAQIGQATVTHPAIPAEDMMQAFIYRHLVPSAELMVLVAPAPRWAPVLQITGGSPLRVPAGGTAPMQITAPAVAFVKTMTVELNAAPEGLTLKEANVVAGGLSLVLEADKAKLKPGYADNLILEAFVDNEVKRGDGKTAKFRSSLGVLPAVPVEIVE